MPARDGTGPEGQGPMTGRGEGYCVVPLDRVSGAPYGLAGIRGRPVSLFWPRPVRWLRPLRPMRRRFGWRRTTGRRRWW